MKLTQEELNEAYNVTIGRLRSAIKQNNTQRALALLEKITQESSDIMYRVEENQNNLLDIFDIMKPYREGVN